MGAGKGRINFFFNTKGAIVIILRFISFVDADNLLLRSEKVPRVVGSITKKEFFDETLAIKVGDFAKA